MQKEVLIRLQA